MADTSELYLAAYHLQAAKMFQLASFVFLIYDHLITLSDEVEQVWMKNWSGATLLFALNRYITPLQFLIIIVAFHSEAWTKNVPACEHFVRFEGGVTLALVAICEVIMMMRVYALWGRDNRVLALLSLSWIAQVAGSALALSFSKRAPLPPGFVGCILTGKNVLLLPIWAMPLITDTLIFALTLWRTREYMGYRSSMPLLRLIVRDGTLYFFCIFAANLLNTVLYLAATPQLKALGASFSQMITSVMISRLVLNLRSLNNESENYGTTHRDSGRPVVMARSPRREVIPMTHLGSTLTRNHAVDNSRTHEVGMLSTQVDVPWKEAGDKDSAAVPGLERT